MTRNDVLVSAEEAHTLVVQNAIEWRGIRPVELRDKGMLNLRLTRGHPFPPGSAPVTVAVPDGKAPYRVACPTMATARRPNLVVTVQ